MSGLPSLSTIMRWHKTHSRYQGANRHALDYVEGLVAEVKRLRDDKRRLRGTIMELQEDTRRRSYDRAQAVVAMELAEDTELANTALREQVEELKALLVEANDAFDEATGDYPKELVEGEAWRAYRTVEVADERFPSMPGDET